MNKSPLVLKIAFGICLLFMLMSPVHAQEIGSWQATTSLLSINEMVVDNDGQIWAITDGGLLHWTENGVFESITPIDGLYRLRPSAITYEPASGLLWLGYNDGTIQSFNPKTFLFRNMNDIRRNQNFTNRAVNRMQIIDQTLYVATAFGLVLIDVDRRLVMDSYAGLGSFERAIPVHDFAVVGRTIYAATNSGIAAGDLDNINLVEPSNWDNSDGAGQLGTLTSPVRTIFEYDGILYAGLENENRSFDGQEWASTQQFSAPVTSVTRSESNNHLVAVGNAAITVLFDDGTSETVSYSTGAEFRSARLLDTNSQSSLIAGTRSAGLLEYTPVTSEPINHRPPGPELNFFTDFTITETDKIAGSTNAPGRFGVNLDFSGYFIYRDNDWVGFDRSNNQTLADANFESVYQSAVMPSHYFFGSWGRGLAKHDKVTDEITVYNTTNSPLDPIFASNTFTVVTGIEPGPDSKLWITTFLSANNGLYHYDPQTSQWEIFSYPPEVTSGTFFQNLMVDSYGQAWIGLGENFTSGRGILVWDPSLEDQPRAVRLTSNQNQGNLPDEQLNVAIQDRRGEVWIGTARGVARFLFPERVIRGGAQDRQASFLINADTSAASPFLLRDVHVTAMAVNAANQKWIGSLTDGIWLIDENGRNVIRHFTTENSPLFSNNITGIGVDDQNGQVYIATSEGMLTYFDVVKQESRSMNDLFVFPNPYSYNRNTGSVFIEGLAEETSLSVITLDGRLINRLETRGGRAEWNVRDFNGNRVATGVYLIVANDARGSEKGVGKIAIIR